MHIDFTYKLRKKWKYLDYWDEIGKKSNFYDDAFKKALKYEEEKKHGKCWAFKGAWSADKRECKNLIKFVYIMKCYRG